MLDHNLKTTILYSFYKLNFFFYSQISTTVCLSVNASEYHLFFFLKHFLKQFFFCFLGSPGASNCADDCILPSPPNPKKKGYLKILSKLNPEVLCRGGNHKPRQIPFHFELPRDLNARSIQLVIRVLSFISRPKVHIFFFQMKNEGEKKGVF